MIDYPHLKLVHILLVCTSLSLFFLRAMWALREELQSQGRWVKWLPATVDSLLLLSGLILIHLSGLSPLNQPWLALKLLLLFGYIALGALALNYGPRSTRPLLLLGSTVVVLTMVYLARFKPLLQ